jgi:uncharacterized protein (TIGR03435 family)
MLPRRTLLTLALASGLGLTLARAQTPPDPKPPAYDVVSVKLNKSSRAADFDIDTDDHTYSAKGISVKQLLESAYKVKGYLISGIPNSIDSARFDINAKILETDPALLAQLDKQRGAMIQALLADRFKLTAHRETKTLPVYELVVAKGGIKFQPSGPDVRPGTHMQGTGRTGFEATGLFMDGLANYLEDRVERNILDKTGLPGRYDLSLNWADDANPQADSAPSIFTALPEQLGLKLQPAKGPVETLVVDHVEMPTDN